jgi:hypothetical protein
MLAEHPMFAISIDTIELLSKFQLEKGQLGGVKKIMVER